MINYYKLFIEQFIIMVFRCGIVFGLLHYHYNQLLQCKENELCIDVYNEQSYIGKCLSNLLQFEPCKDMFKVISDVMAHWYDM